jgi:hypothetical protein
VEPGHPAGRTAASAEVDDATVAALGEQGIQFAVAQQQQPVRHGAIGDGQTSIVW